MNPNSPGPDSVLMDVRERLVRIETKMDASAEKTSELQAQTENNADRLTSLEAEAASLRQAMATLKWVGGSAMAVLSLFGDRLVNLMF